MCIYYSSCNLFIITNKVLNHTVQAYASLFQINFFRVYEVSGSSVFHLCLPLSVIDLRHHIFIVYCKLEFFFVRFLILSSFHEEVSTASKEKAIDDVISNSMKFNLRNSVYD